MNPSSEKRRPHARSRLHRLTGAPPHRLGEETGSVEPAPPFGMVIALAILIALGGSAYAGTRASERGPHAPAQAPASAVAFAEQSAIAPAPPADAPYLPRLAREGASRSVAEALAHAPAVEAPPEPPAGPDRIPLVPVPERLAAFRGLSTWIDLYDEIAPEQQVELAGAGGVETIFIQSARFNSPADVHKPDELGRVIERAHDLGMKVMVWYIPDHVDPLVDLRRSQAAIAFTTPRGDRADAFGLDIEMEAVRDVALRTQSLLTLSAALRQWVGPEYPMAAIVLPPLQLERNQQWWPNFPYASLRPFYDVYIPMSYSSYRGEDYDTTYQWNVRNIVGLRELVGDPSLLIHMAGGIADDLPAVDAFVNAARDGGVIGGGLYDLETTPPTSWEQLRRLRSR